MNCRTVALLIPAVLTFLGGCAHRRGCDDPDPTPSHTFGRGGIYERDGRLLPPRKHCATCDYLGMKCPKCQAACDGETFEVNEPTRELKAQKPASDADALIQSLKTNPLPKDVPTRESSEDGTSDAHSTGDGEVRRWRSPYAPIQSSIPTPPWDR